MNNGPQISQAMQPFYSFISTLLPILLGAVLVLGAIHCIALGYALAHSDEGEQGNAEKAKKAFKNAIIGYASIFISIGIMYLARVPLIEWLGTITNDWDFTGSVSTFLC